MNYYNKVAEMFDLELEEEFKINSIKNYLFMFTKGGLMFRYINDFDWADSCSPILTGLLRGNYTIERLPFKPRYGDEYYYYSSVLKATSRKVWGNNTPDYLHWKTGNCFRSEKEAETKGKAIMEEIVKDYIKSIGIIYDVNSLYPKAFPEAVYEKNKR